MPMHPTQIEYIPRGYGIGLQEVTDFLWKCASDVRNDFSSEVLEDYTAAVDYVSALLTGEQESIMWINYTCPKCQRESKPRPLLFSSVGAATLSGKGRECSYDHDAYPMDVVIATEERYNEWLSTKH